MLAYRCALSISLALTASVASAQEVKPLDQIIDLGHLSRDHLSLSDPTLRANVASFDSLAQDFNPIAGKMAQHRDRYVTRAVRFAKIPDGMMAEDLIRAWREAGGSPKVFPPRADSIYWNAHDDDNGHSVTDSQIGTGFECGHKGTPGLLFNEIWARRFLLVTADGHLVQVEPPKCE